MRNLLSTMMSVALLGPASLAFAAEPAGAAQIQYAKPDQAGEQHARQAVADLKKADPSLMRLFDEAAGYAVFATVGKGAVGVGGAHGTGLLYEKGAMVGKVTLTQLTVGLALGAQAYTEVVFFETEKALADFKKGEVTLAAQVSAVVVKAGASASAKYVDGMSVFTYLKGGVMAEASVGGQKFGYQPYLKAITVNDR
jgi:lipid-binding SYLF domain-containing protein